jgi:hypothetical protein
MDCIERPPGYGLFKSLRYHAVIAQELRKRPEAVLTQARAVMDRWGWLSPEHEAYQAKYAHQWRLAVERGLEQIVACRSVAGAHFGHSASRGPQNALCG